MQWVIREYEVEFGGVGDESGGAGGHIPMLNAKSLKNSEIWPKT